MRHKQDEIKFWIVWIGVLIFLAINLFVHCGAQQIAIDPDPEHKPKPPILDFDYEVLDESLRANRTKIFIMPVFIPCMWCLKDLDERLVEEKQLDRIAREGLGNAERAFAFCSFKGIDTYMPSDPEWLPTMKRRIRERVKRGILPIVTLIDHCSTYGDWVNHPWYNPDGKDAIFNPDHPVFQNKVIPYIRHLVTELEKEFSPFIAYEIGNEVPAGLIWHRKIRRVLKECGVIQKWRVITSLSQGNEETYYFDFRMLNFLNISIHHVTDRDSYNELKYIWNIEAHFSEDGRYPQKGGWEYKQLVKQILKEGGLGYESNACHPARWGQRYVPDKWPWDILEGIGRGFRDSIF